MPATPKSLRQPPPRNFGDYSLTHETDPAIGQYPISDLILKSVPGYTGEPGAKDAYEEIEIGFGFLFDQKTYTRAIVSTSGWVALATSNAGIVTPSSLFDESNTVSNWSIHIKNAGCILLAPWFDALINVTVADDYNDPLQKYRKGIDPYNGALNQTKAGVKFFRGNDPHGRYLLIRWSSYVDATNINIFDFDCLVYENGTIEYRYSPPKEPYKENDPAVEYAVVGLFLPSNAPGTNYRDCGSILSNAADSRGLYRRGGTVWDNVYTDTANSNTSNYTISLSPLLHWPAMRNNGAIFRFSPPVNKRRNNRRIIAARDSKLISPAGAFDDRKTTYFVADTMNYPAGLPVNRPYTTSYKGVHSTLDLFSLGDLELPRTGSGGMYDQLLEETFEDTPEDGFREVALHEQGKFGEVFFSEGSSIFFGEVPGGLSGELAGKEILRLTLPVKVSTAMPGLTSSIYYYNTSMGRWNVPTGALGDLTSQFEAFSFDTRWTPAYGMSEQQYTPGSVISEDARGFDAYGRPIASGSSDVYRNVSTASFPGEFNQTISVLGQRPTSNGMMLEAISKPYGKSLPQNVDYSPTRDEMFTAPIQQPFLLEKAVFELPLAAARGWFDDRTTTSAMLVSGVYSSDGLTELNRQLYIATDRGGPALTLALFCLKPGPTGTMELIASGTIIPAADVRSAGVCSIDDLRYSPIPTFVFGQSGIACPAAAVVPVGDQFTGSVVVPLTAAVSNGTTTMLIKSLSVNSAAPSPPATSTWNDASILAWISGSLSAPMYTVTASSRAGENIVTLGVNSLGRAQGGFVPGGGSAFGGDMITYARHIEEESSTIENPFYISSEASRTIIYNDAVSKLAMLRAAHPTATLSFLATGDVETQGSRPSPYLLNPGDKLVLAVSKTRPATHFVRGSITGSTDADIGRGRAEKVLRFNSNCILDNIVPHDVALITGSINISMYGSYVGNGMKRGTL